MNRLTVQDKNTIEKYKKRVHKQYPGAYLVSIESGWYTIIQDQSDLSQKDILAELCFTPQKDPIKAWELAQLTVKSTQNLNRTHPLRIEGMNMEDKIARVEARRLKKESALEMRKRKSIDIY
jgi:hypothetical protein